MNKSIKILGLIAVIMISSLLIFATQKSDSNNNNFLKEGDKNTSETYEIKALKIPENLLCARVALCNLNEYIEKDVNDKNHYL